jgi:hypothetical protein
MNFLLIFTCGNIHSEVIECHWHIYIRSMFSHEQDELSICIHTIELLDIVGEKKRVCVYIEEGKE